MAISKIDFKAPSSNGAHVLSGVVFLPESSPKGYFHIVHGMTEHIARYEKFMLDMAQNGYVVFGFDNLGHGNTANSDEELGFIAKENGWDILAKDVKVFSDAVINEYSKEYGALPYYLMGHSMGSFIVRVAAEKYVTPQKLVVMGTGGSNPAADAGLLLISILKAFKGERHISPLIENIAFGSYNDRFGGGTDTDPKPWLTNDEGIRQKYYADKFCTFKFTVSAMGDLIRLIKECNRKDWYKNVAQKMPILLVSGAEDPVGNYGKGILEVKDKLEKQSANVECILYENARHEILNDFTYDKVKQDIIKFCEK